MLNPIAPLVEQLVKLPGVGQKSAQRLAFFILSMPVASEQRMRWGPTAVAYLRRGGLLYSWGLRHLLMVAPLLVCIVYPLAGPIAAALVVAALFAFDRFQTSMK